MALETHGRLCFSGMTHLARWLTKGPGSEWLDDLVEARAKELAQRRELVVVEIDSDGLRPLVRVYGTEQVSAVVRNRMAGCVGRDATEADEWMRRSLPRAFRGRAMRQKAIEVVERIEPIDVVVRAAGVAVLKDIRHRYEY